MDFHWYIQIHHSRIKYGVFISDVALWELFTVLVRLSATLADGISMLKASRSLLPPDLLSKYISFCRAC